MKLQEIKPLNESITFHAAISVEDTKHGKYYDSGHFQKEEKVECWVCDGTGKDPYHDNHECGMCKGEKKISEYVTPYKSLNVSNVNAAYILELLGKKIESDGVWVEKELPLIRRELIKLKNKDVEKYTIDRSENQNSARSFKDENGMDRISRGPKIIDMGVSKNQLENYIDTLLDLIDFAQKNNAVVTWC